MATEKSSLPVIAKASNLAEISIASAEEARIREIIDASIAQVAEELKRVNRTVSSSCIQFALVYKLGYS
jgi:hypothetical protein